LQEAGSSLRRRFSIFFVLCFLSFALSQLNKVTALSAVGRAVVVVVTIVVAMRHPSKPYSYPAIEYTQHIGCVDGLVNEFVNA